MDLSNPMRSVIPSAHGAVLAVLVRTTEPLSGRRVAELTYGRVGQPRTNAILGELTAAGIVLSESRPPSKLYRLNRDHVAAPGIVALADMWGTLVDRIKTEIQSWDQPPLAACLFGSAARGTAVAESDVDLLVVRAEAEGLPSDDDCWHLQIEQLAERVRLWSGNDCEVLELSPSELLDAATRQNRLAGDLAADAIGLFGPDVRTLLRKGVAV